MTEMTLEQGREAQGQRGILAPGQGAMRGPRSSRGSRGMVVQPTPVSRHNKDPREGGCPLRPWEARTRVSSLLAAHQLRLRPPRS